jgi:DNA-binding GntR family transcriptional regulator
MALRGVPRQPQLPREALRQLVQEGLVEHQVHRGIFVRRITADDAIDVYRAREAVELAAFGLVLAGGDDLDFAVLDVCIAEMNEAAARDGSSVPRGCRA